jgi:hypothetical protein
MTTLTLENLCQATELLDVSKEDLLQLLIDQKRYDEAIECCQTVEEAKFAFYHLWRSEFLFVDEDQKKQQVDHFFKIWEILSLQAVASFDEKTPKDEIEKMWPLVAGNAVGILRYLRKIAGKKESILTKKADIRSDIGQIRYDRIMLAELREKVKK